MRRVMLLVAGGLVTAACGMSTPPGVEDVMLPGSLSFDYTGAGDNTVKTFQASGLISNSHPTWETTSPVVAGQYNTLAIKDYAEVVGAIPTNGTSWNQILLTVRQLAVATIPIDGNCPTCSHVQFEIQAQHGGLIKVKPDWVCTIVTGQITITVMTLKNYQGTFSGTGICQPPSNESTPFTVTNGKFDVPVVYGLTKSEPVG